MWGTFFYMEKPDRETVNVEHQTSPSHSHVQPGNATRRLMSEGGGGGANSDTLNNFSKSHTRREGR